MCAGFWWGDPGIDRIILRWIFREWDVGSMYWIELAWIGTGGGHL